VIKCGRVVAGDNCFGFSSQNAASRQERLALGVCDKKKLEQESLEFAVRFRDLFLIAA
jgi:hypothetical protein